MIVIRKSEERHHVEKKDRKTWMTFDTENKADPLKNGFAALEILKYAFNTSENEDAHVVQCGLNPCVGLSQPRGSKMLFTHAERQGILKLIASSDGRDSSLAIQQDIQIYSTFPHKGNHIIHEIGSGRSAWLHVVSGHIALNDLDLLTGDGAGFSDEKTISFMAKTPTEILLFNLCGQISEEIKTNFKDKLLVSEIR
jgi:redox-sensitive bicupin YhaK (pirin superfamily)